MSDKAELRRLCDEIENCGGIAKLMKGGLFSSWIKLVSPSSVRELLDECDGLERFKTAYMEWQDKTDWVRKDAKPKELGMHVADVMTARITKAEAERDADLAELEACRKDAERYRWLRTYCYGALMDYEMADLFSHNDDIIDEKIDELRAPSAAMSQESSNA